MAIVSWAGGKESDGRGCLPEGWDVLVSLIGLAFSAWGVLSAWRSPSPIWIVAGTGAAAATVGKGRTADGDLERVAD